MPTWPLESVALVPQSGTLLDRPTSLFFVSETQIANRDELRAFMLAWDEHNLAS